MKLLSWFRKQKNASPSSEEENSVGIKQTNHSITKQTLDQAFQGCADIQTDEMTFGEDHTIHVLFIYSDGLCDTKRLNKEILPTLAKLLDHKLTKPLTRHTLVTEWHKRSLEIETNMNSLVSKVFEGQLTIFIENIQTAYTLDIANPPNRTPEETNTEITIRGPRDGFIEDLSVNVAILRKRLRSNTLKYEQHMLGERSQTKIGLIYVDDIMRPEVLDEVKRRLSTIDIDAIINANQLEELMMESDYPLFPIFHYTGRPDFTIDSLLSGRFALFVDGLPTAIIGPLNFMFLLKTAEDSEIHFLYNSFERLLRLAGIWVASSLPGLWIALTSFHPDQIPLVLISSLTEARQEVPLPPPLEALIMVLLFELFREAGMRLPMAIGQILTVVGGLIIGDAAIRAGVTSPAMVVIVATSAVATFTLVNQSLQGIISIIRVFIVVCSSFLGMFGFLLSSFLVLLYAANLRSFGLPYLAPLSPLQFRDMIYAVFRPQWKKKKQRPNMFQPKDSHRQGDSS